MTLPVSQPLTTTGKRNNESKTKKGNVGKGEDGADANYERE